MNADKVSLDVCLDRGATYTLLKSQTYNKIKEHCDEIYWLITVEAKLDFEKDDSKDRSYVGSQSPNFPYGERWGII